MPCAPQGSNVQLRMSVIKFFALNELTPNEIFVYLGDRANISFAGSAVREAFSAASILN